MAIVNLAQLSNLQRQGFLWATQKENERRAAQTPPLPPITPQDYADARLTEMANSYVEQARQERLSQNVVRNVAEAYSGAVPEVQTQVRQLLSVPDNRGGL